MCVYGEEKGRGSQTNVVVREIRHEAIVEEGSRRDEENGLHARRQRVWLAIRPTAQGAKRADTGGPQFQIVLRLFGPKKGAAHARAHPKAANIEAVEFG